MRRREGDLFGNLVTGNLVTFSLTDYKRKKCQGARKFDGFAEFSLVPGAGRVTLGGINLALSVHKTAQKVRVFVVDGIDMLFAKVTLFHKTGDR